MIQAGYLPNLMEFQCSTGTWAPSTAPKCLPAACPVGVISVSGAASPACTNAGATGLVASGSNCVKNCQPGHTADGGTFSCALGVWSGAYTCTANSCTVPAVTNSAAFCSEGSTIAHAGKCTAQCQSGYVPTVASYDCQYGQWVPAPWPAPRSHVWSVP